MSASDINQLSYNNKKTARNLLIVAFIVEFAVASLAVFVGFSFISSGSDALQSEGFDTLINSRLMEWGVVGVYILIAVIELTRVPLVISIFRGQSLLWKFIGTFSLITIMALAAMSMYIAQTNMGALRDGKITTQDYKIDLSRSKIDNLEKEINSLSVLTLASINEQYDLRILDIDEERNKQIKPLENELERLNTEKKEDLAFDTEKLDSLVNEKFQLEEFVNNSGLSQNDKETALKNELQTQKEKERAEFVTDRDSRLASLKDLFDSEVKNLALQIDKTRSTLAELNAELSKTEEEGIIFRSQKGDRASLLAQIEEQNVLLNDFIAKETLATETYRNGVNEVSIAFDDKILGLDEKYNNLVSEGLKNIDMASQSELNEKLSRLSQLTETLQLNEQTINQKIAIVNSEYESLITPISTKISEINAKFEVEREEEKNVFNQNISKLDEQDTKIASLKDLITAENEKIQTANEIKLNYTKMHPVYKAAPAFKFLEACVGIESELDVTQGCKKDIEFIWFGAISLVVAVAGSALAFASEIVRTADERYVPRRKNRGSNTRHLLIKIVRYTLKPRVKKVNVDRLVEVEVPKIVTEEKIVYKEVPKEIIRREISHVPVATMRADLLEKEEKKKPVKKTSSANNEKDEK